MKNEGYGAQGYVVTKQGAANILSKIYPLKVPYDLALRNEMKAYNIAYNFDELSFLKRNNNRESSIGLSSNETTNYKNYNYNEKQSMTPLYKRLIEKIIKDPDVDLDNYLTSE